MNSLAMKESEQDVKVERDLHQALLCLKDANAMMLDHNFEADEAFYRETEQYLKGMFQLIISLMATTDTRKSLDGETDDV